MVYVFNTPWFDSGYKFGVSLRLLLEQFHIFYVKGTRRVTRGSHSNIISTSSSYDVRDGFLQHFAAFFALRPAGRECPFFSPR